MPKNYSSESGNIIIFIFIAIVLLAALAYVVSQGSRSGESALSGEKANLAAIEILDYANAIRGAVRELKINGCDETEISFENNMVTIYNNPSAPSDNSCHVFNGNGAGQIYIRPNPSVLETSHASATDLYYGEWSFFGRHCIAELGNCPTNAQLILNLSQIQNSVCEKINERANISTIPTVNWNVSKTSSSEFTGSFTEDGSTELNNVGLNGKTFGCFQDNAGAGSGQNIFYQVLLTR